jgi:hypothetical protein
VYFCIPQSAVLALISLEALDTSTFVIFFAIGGF